MALFPPAPGGGKEVEHGYKGKGSLLHLVVDKKGNPLWVTSTSAKGDERKQALVLLDHVSIAQIKDNQTMSICEADKGYDSDPLRSEILNKGYVPLIGHRKNRVGKISTKMVADFFQIVRIRWKVERAFAWIKRRCRRLLMRWERLPELWEAFATTGVIYMWLKILVG